MTHRVFWGVPASMVVIARIPRLDRLIDDADAGQKPAGIAADAGPIAAAETAPPDIVPRAAPIAPARRREGLRFPVASTMVLAVIAGACWAAVWRQEQLRAVEDQATGTHAEGMAALPESTGQNDGSVTR